MYTFVEPNERSGNHHRSPSFLFWNPDIVDRADVFGRFLLRQVGVAEQQPLLR